MKSRRLITLARRAFAMIAGKPFVPKGVRIGKDVFIGADVQLDSVAGGSLIAISDLVTIADGARILCHDASSNRRIGGTRVAPVTIGERAFIGANAIVLPGVSVGADSIVAAGAVVTRDVEPGTVVAGVPAIPIGTVAELDRRRTLDMRDGSMFEARIYGVPEVSADKIQQLAEATRREGEFFLITKEVYEKNQDKTR